jgi:hypothetical protein
MPPAGYCGVRAVFSPIRVQHGAAVFRFERAHHASKPMPRLNREQARKVLRDVGRHVEPAERRPEGQREPGRRVFDSG